MSKVAKLTSCDYCRVLETYRCDGPQFLLQPQYLLPQICLKIMIVFIEDHTVCDAMLRRIHVAFYKLSFLPTSHFNQTCPVLIYLQCRTIYKDPVALCLGLAVSQNFQQDMMGRPGSIEDVLNSDWKQPLALEVPKYLALKGSRILSSKGAQKTV